MTDTELIDAVMNFTDQIDPTDADAASRRLRIAQWLREVAHEIWHLRDFDWKLQETTTLTYPSGSVAVDLPADFDHVPEQGGLYNSRTRLQEIPARIMTTYLANAQPTSAPLVYSVLWRNPNTSRRQLQLPPVSGTIALKLYYALTPPPFALEADNDLEAWFPIQYHQTVFLPGVIAKARRSKGDGDDWKRKYEDGIAYMVLREMPRQSEVQRLPRAVLSQW